MTRLWVDHVLADAFAHFNAGRLAESEALCKQACAAVPDHPDVIHLLGLLAWRGGRNDDAVPLFRRAIAARPTDAEFHSNLGNLLCLAGRHAEAAAAFGEALRLRPSMAEAHNGMGNALRGAGAPDEAIASYRAALLHRPGYAGALANLAVALKDVGLLDAAFATYGEALRIQPQGLVAHDVWLLPLHYHPDFTPAQIFAEHRRWNDQHARPLGESAAPHLNPPDPARRLRVGYVSPDFRGHPVGRFMLPLLANHDADAVEVYCYSNSAEVDAVTGMLRSHADAWRPVAPLSDERVAGMVREDGIDVLVDLAMHTAGSRMLVFARRPAPVQVTFLAYCSTTGTDAVGYRLSDPYLDPPDWPDAGRYSETTVRLPETFWCYPGEPGAPDPEPPPSASAGVVTFGCLNSVAKVSPPALALWARLLRAVPGSRLLLLAGPASLRRRLHEGFAAAGVEPARVEFVTFSPAADYFGHYHRVDVGLDTFPATGGTTTCDALWMGVPVVTLAGRTAMGRGGVSILSNVGLPELIAETELDYVRLASELAGDAARLRDLRCTMRDRMRSSPLMNAERYAREVESAYRVMWHAWCASTPNRDG